MKTLTAANKTPLCEGLLTPHHFQSMVSPSIRTTETVRSTQTARSGDRRRTSVGLGALRRVPSCLAAIAAVAVIALPIFGGPVGWHDRLYDPTTFLTALTFAGVAMVLWPLERQTPCDQ